LENRSRRRPPPPTKLSGRRLVTRWECFQAFEGGTMRGNLLAPPLGSPPEIRPTSSPFIALCNGPGPRGHERPTTGLLPTGRKRGGRRIKPIHPGSWPDRCRGDLAEGPTGLIRVTKKKRAKIFAAFRQNGGQATRWHEADISHSAETPWAKQNTRRSFAFEGARTRKYEGFSRTA